MDLIPLFQKQLREVAAVLAGDTCDERDLLLGHKLFFLDAIFFLQLKLQAYGRPARK